MTDNIDTLAALTITTDFDGFSKMVVEFIKMIPGSNLDQLDNGLKAIGLAYLGVKCESAVEEIMLIQRLEFANKHHLKAVLALYGVNS